jgi:hypothetical protein
MGKWTNFGRQHESYKHDERKRHHQKEKDRGHKGWK